MDTVHDWSIHTHKHTHTPAHIHSPTGTVEFNLHGMPEPVKNSGSCSLDQLPEEGREVKLVDLFKKKTIKGWWPTFTNEEGVRELAVSGVVWLYLLAVSEVEKRIGPS